MCKEYSKYKIAIIASGNGSNARAIIDYFEKHTKISVQLLLTNKASSGIITISEEYNIDHFIFDKNQFQDKDAFSSILIEGGIDYIILAGFLWKIPNYLIKAYPKKILNIHPSLLPKYGGKGMYGIRVHEAVLANKEKTTGLTIHIVNENYDEGEILFQHKIHISDAKTAQEIGKKVLEKEHKFYPRIIEEYILNLKET